MRSEQKRPVPFSGSLKRKLSDASTSVACCLWEISSGLNLYAIYARNGTINILLPFTDLLCNAQPYVTCPASFLSHLHLRS